ncbi:MAG TPA: HAD hydrolase-like protein, partial [Phycisphaerae bacterium]|nr:HAD hydrolase-like protein [Phycisphaerae bacterium]
RLYTDMAMARRAGALGVLVLTGEATRDDATTCPEPPDLVLRSIEELGELLVTARQAGGAP